MRILLLCHSFNSLTQRLHVELTERGHDVSVEFDVNDDVAREAVALFGPDLILAPFLKRAIPEDIWREVLCLIVHPGVRGDRGPSGLDWAILADETTWGVTLIEARAEMDAGPVWAWREFPMRTATKSSLYRHEVTEAAVACVLEALDHLGSGSGRAPVAPHNEGRGSIRSSCGAAARKLDFTAQDSATVLRIIRASDGTPGAIGSIFNRNLRFYDAHDASGLCGVPGAALAKSGPAVAVATRDGAVWIGHAKSLERGSLKLPTTQVLHGEIASLPEIAGYPIPHYEEEGGTGFLYFSFYNGAMATGDCRELLAAVRRALQRPTRVLVLMGGADYWSNGLHLGIIEAAASPAEESWTNISAMNDLVEAIIRTDDRLLIAAVRGNAGAGGVFLALACDEIWMRDGVILNPHYKDMGNLYGSEFWTYLLPRRVGIETATKIAQTRLPMGVYEAKRLGLIDRPLPNEPAEADNIARAAARSLAQNADLADRIASKRVMRLRDEAAKPLALYGAEELARMRVNFFGFDPSYHVARFNFIRKIAKSRTPMTLARHRSRAHRLEGAPLPREWSAAR
ncbi:MAG: enoyl-CoA hydratase-related protein [Beijerinckiaceae bacterium]